MSDKPFTLKKTWREGDSTCLVDFLEKHTHLSKTVIKKNLNNGGVWVRLNNDSRLSKVRKATFVLTKESHVEFYYDPKWLNSNPPEAKELTTFKEWGIWYKPAGLLSQGTFFGDHFSILRQVEKKKNKAWLIHRLDREAHGLMIFAYSKNAAKLFSYIFQNHQIRKFYKVKVLGEVKKDAEINSKLDGKEAKTAFKVIESGAFESELLVEIFSGRLHQVRRHLESINHPVLGDPKYGIGNKNSEGLQLLAYQLIFVDPFTKKKIDFIIPDIYL